VRFAQASSFVEVDSAAHRTTLELTGERTASSPTRASDRSDRRVHFQLNADP